MTISHSQTRTMVNRFSLFQSSKASKRRSTAKEIFIFLGVIKHNVLPVWWDFQANDRRSDGLEQCKQLLSGHKNSEALTRYKFEFLRRSSTIDRIDADLCARKNKVQVY
jgi:hypothetical protein